MKKFKFFLGDAVGPQEKNRIYQAFGLVEIGKERTIKVLSGKEVRLLLKKKRRGR